MDNNTFPVGDAAQPNINDTTNTNTSVKKKNKKLLISLIAILSVLLVGGGVFAAVFFMNQNSLAPQESNPTAQKPASQNKFALTSNSISDFDLQFLKIEEDGRSNIVYSPLSIKYTLAMIGEGAEDETKQQIEDILGDYEVKSYKNSENLSLANALFINEAYEDLIKNSYKENIAENYQAELIVDDFNSADNINSWISNKTFGMINNLLSDQDLDPTIHPLVAVNSLAIDMEWVNLIQPDEKSVYVYDTSFEHEVYNSQLLSFRYRKNDDTDNAEIAATANKYNIVEELGENEIRNTVQSAYEEWAEDPFIKENCSVEGIEDQAPDLEEYIKILREHYGYLDSSTDFEFYVDDDIKVFAKDLKKYDGTALQYIGIMPRTQSLSNYIKSISAEDIIDTINNLKPLEVNSFSEGVITKLTGKIPLFDFDYELGLQKDLIEIGIVDLFSKNDANLTGIAEDHSELGSLYIDKAKNKTNIAFSNEGIKASSSTAFIGGWGHTVGCTFNYNFEVPIEEIDLTFDKPYFFTIIDKDSGEAWFMGVVYEPLEFIAPTPYY